MATKENFLFNDKSKLCNNLKNDARYSNLNLNAPNKCLNIDKISSKNISNKNERRIIGFADANNYRSINNDKSWNKNDQNSRQFQTFSLNSDKEDIQNQWKKTGFLSASKSNSTLSLHISAYENSIDNHGEEDLLSKSKFDMARKKIGDGSGSSTMAFFEIPRQQENESSEPEIMQFKASQKLLNCQQRSSASDEESDSPKKKARTDVDLTDKESFPEHLFIDGTVQTRYFKDETVITFKFPVGISQAYLSATRIEGGFQNCVFNTLCLAEETMQFELPQWEKHQFTFGDKIQTTDIVLPDSLKDMMVRALRKGYDYFIQHAAKKEEIVKTSSALALMSTPAKFLSFCVFSQEVKGKEEDLLYLYLTIAMENEILKECSKFVFDLGFIEKAFLIVIDKKRNAIFAADGHPHRETRQGNEDGSCVSKTSTTRRSGASITVAHLDKIKDFCYHLMEEYFQPKAEKEKPWLFQIGLLVWDVRAYQTKDAEEDLKWKKVIAKLTKKKEEKEDISTTIFGTNEQRKTRYRDLIHGKKK